MVHHTVWTLDVALWGHSLRWCSCSHGLCPVFTGCANVLMSSTESGHRVGSLEREVWVSIFFRSFWPCVSVWPFGKILIWHIYWTVERRAAGGSEWWGANSWHHPRGPQARPQSYEDAHHRKICFEEPWTGLFPLFQHFPNPAARVWAHLSELFATGLSTGIRSLSLYDFHLFACVGNVFWAPLIVTARCSWGYI